MIDIQKHTLVPEHVVLSKKDKDEVLQKFTVTEQQLPKILESDPMVKKIKAQPGDVIRIKRQSPTAGESVYYRIVVPG